MFELIMGISPFDSGCLAPHPAAQVSLTRCLGSICLFFFQEEGAKSQRRSQTKGTQYQALRHMQ